MATGSNTGGDYLTGSTFGSLTASDTYSEYSVVPSDITYRPAEYGGVLYAHPNTVVDLLPLLRNVKEEDMSEFNKFVAKQARELSEQQVDDLYDIMQEKDWRDRIMVSMLVMLLKRGSTLESLGYEREE